MRIKFVCILVILINTSNLFSQDNMWNNVDMIVNKLDSVVFPDITYNIEKYGAIANGITPCKEVFDKVIQICSNNGGGKIVVPKGIYYMNGPLVLKSNVNIHLEEGAVINFGSDEKDYLPEVLTRWEGTELYNYSPLIYAYHVQNIAITGEGVLNGNATKNFNKWKKKQNSDKERLRRMGKDNTPVYKRLFGEGSFLRPGFFESFGCSNVRIEGVTFVESPFWVIHPIFCNNVIIRDVKIKSKTYNSDGFDPESCRNVLIEDCDFETGDDAIAIKSGRDNDAWRVGQPTENVVIRNCTFRSKINGVCIGSEIAGGVRNVFIENVRIYNSTNALYFKSNTNRGGYINNIHVRNIQIDTVRSSVIKFEPNYKKEGHGLYPTKFENFYIENVECKLSKGCGIYISAFEKLPIENIVIKDVNISRAHHTYSLENGKNILFKNVCINGEKMPMKPTPKKFFSRRE